MLSRSTKVWSGRTSVEKKHGRLRLGWSLGVHFYHFCLLKVLTEPVFVFFIPYGFLGAKRRKGDYINTVLPCVTYSSAGNDIEGSGGLYFPLIQQLYKFKAFYFTDLEHFTLQIWSILLYRFGADALSM